jgi:uncharacterized membrane protein YqaE (UPF0057 family)
MAETQLSSNADTNKLLLIIIAILLPPVAVLLKDGVGLMLIISIVLWIAFVIPGIIFAIWRVLS